MRTAYTTSVYRVARLSLVRQGYDWSAPGRPEPLRGGETNFERSPDRWFRLGRTAARLSSVPRPWLGPAPCGHTREQLRGDLPEELSFSLNRGQRMDQMLERSGDF